MWYFYHRFFQVSRFFSGSVFFIETQKPISILTNRAPSKVGKFGVTLDTAKQLTFLRGVPYLSNLNLFST